MPIEPGTKLGRYEIRSKLGEGGMGEVYLAEYTPLRRSVALKVLPSELAANQDRMRRFVQEAQAEPRSIIQTSPTSTRIGKSEGANFIAMEFVEGVTLRQKIIRNVRWNHGKHQQQLDAAA